MKASIDYNEAFESMQEDVSKLVATADRKVTPCLKEIGSVIATEVQRHAVRSDNEYYWSNGVRKPNTHIIDDVTYKVGRARKTKAQFVSVSGGKKTWAKWILANDGHVAENGRFVPGNHFVDKTEKASERNVERIVDRFLKEIVNG